MSGRQGKYVEYERRVLEYLCTVADSGECETPSLLKQVKIRKQSASDVLERLEKKGFILRQHSFNNRKRIQVTDQGRQGYQSLSAEQAKYPIPFVVRRYLSYRKIDGERLFPIQQEFVNRGLLHNVENVCAFAYPGAGKTLLAEMSMAQIIGNGGKALYCTPYKALDWQKYNDFSDWFTGGLGAKVVITDGDNSVSQDSLANAQVVVATYERVLGALRRNEKWLQEISLVCADEITLLADPERGGTIDTLLTFSKVSNSKPRVLTLSTIVGNAPSIAGWLHSKLIVENRAHPGVEIREHLVCKNQGVLNYISKNGEERREESNLGPIDCIIRKNLDEGQTTLVFVGPRREAERVATRIKNLHRYDEKLAKLVDAFLQSNYVERTSLTGKLCDLMRYGVAFHHAGLHRSVRRFVEDLLKKDLLRTIVATGTLGHGIDYSIDSVIIDYNSIVGVHPFHSYEYINYKGRAGRPGKSESVANVYVVCKSKADIETAYSKFFTGATEAVTPNNTFEADTVSIIVLTEATQRPLTVDDVCGIINQTLYGTVFGVNARLVKLIMSDMTSQNLFALKNGKYGITDFGKKVNDANLSPVDAKEVLKLSSPSVEKLISLAARIDLVRRLRKSGARRGDPTHMLLQWIDEKPLDEICDSSIGYYDDGDILLFGEYAAIALQKVSALISDTKTEKIIENLAKRLRYGIRADLATTDLIDIPVLARNKSRVICRQLLINGYKNAASVANESPGKLEKVLSISQEMANQIIESAKK